MPGGTEELLVRLRERARRLKVHVPNATADDIELVCNRVEALQGALRQAKPHLGALAVLDLDDGQASLALARVEQELGA